MSNEYLNFYYEQFVKLKGSMLEDLFIAVILFLPKIIQIQKSSTIYIHFFKVVYVGMIISNN